MNWNPRYMLYAKEHCKTPEEMVVVDEETYPGGCMTGFMLWTTKKIAKHLEEMPHNRIGGTFLSPAVYDAWLQEDVEKEYEHGL